jgi:hypothetical protein
MLIQLAISDTSYRVALEDLLARHADWQVTCVEDPDLGLPGVVVVDRQHLDQLPNPLDGADRIVLITQKAPGEIARAWESGVTSVVYDNDPLGTAVLAILAARLRCAKPRPS